MVDLTIKLDARAASRMLSDLQKKQLPFATMTALNDVAFSAQASERAAFGSFFRSPRPFTEKSVMVSKAKKGTLISRVFIRPEVSSYLEPFEFGGAHVVPGKLQLVPVFMRLDQFGQIRQATLKKLNELANDPASGVFFGEVHGVRGYWMRPKVRFDPKRAAKGKAQPRAHLKLIAEVEAPTQVTEHLDFIQNASHQVVKAWPEAIQRGMAKAIASAK